MMESITLRSPSLASIVAFNPFPGISSLIGYRLGKSCRNSVTFHSDLELCLRNRCGFLSLICLNEATLSSIHTISVNQRVKKGAIIKDSQLIVPMKHLLGGRSLLVTRMTIVVVCLFLISLISLYRENFKVSKGIVFGLGLWYLAMFSFRSVLYPWSWLPRPRSNRTRIQSHEYGRCSKWFCCLWNTRCCPLDS